MQAQNGWGGAINDQIEMGEAHIYDNAMFLMAINDFISLMPEDYHSDGQLVEKNDGWQLKKKHPPK